VKMMRLLICIPCRVAHASRWAIERASAALPSYNVAKRN
jgi:hypothetical protein